MVLSTADQRVRARVVLVAAAEFYRSKFGTLLACIDRAAKDALDVVFTRRVLRGVLWLSDLAGWESHPMRRRSDVWRALNTAIRWCSRRPGGWQVRGVARPTPARVSPDRQHLEWVRR